MSVRFDIVCLSHLRWDYVYQRPQHLLSRCARERRVFFVEEPVIEAGPAWLEVVQRDPNIWVARAHMPDGLDEDEATRIQENLFREMFAERDVERYVLWYYTPMALAFTRRLEPLAVVYDCMDELSLFSGAPRALRQREAELFARADLVFTGGQSLYEAKRSQHHHVYAFPSSVDACHFARARGTMDDPGDQASIPHPRLGFYGVIDERMDLSLLAGIADARPDWQVVIAGPVAKIDRNSLPRRPNIHYLGAKSYAELPAYLANWDVAIMPFAHNESTRFISPTKTLEYLAAGKPVVSTSIRDVVEPYGRQGLVRIADSAAEFVAAAGLALAEDQADRLPAIDAFLATTSWQRTWNRMRALITGVVSAREQPVLRLPRPQLVTVRQVGSRTRTTGSRVLGFPSPGELALNYVRGEGAE